MSAPCSDPFPRIGVFDSGVGGLSVLRQLRRRWPAIPVSYLADNRHLPYGEKSAHWLVERCTALSAHLLGEGAALVLVACNTATTHTIAALRARWPGVPFVGIEPGIKPAIAATRNGRIAVLATTATLRSERVRMLVEAHASGADVRLHACPGLADAIELADDAAIDRLVQHACDRIVTEQVDTVVLGCTHYPLIASAFANRLGADVVLIDTTDAVCRRVEALLPVPVSAYSGRGALRIEATGDVDAVTRAVRHWLDEAVDVTTSGV